MKFYLATFNRATDGTLSKLKEKLKEKDMFTENYKFADYIIAVADRTETYDFIVKRFKENRKIIHLFAGERSCFATHDDVWRHSMTLMSDIQLCVNGSAFNRVTKLCNAVDKQPNAHIVGNVYLDSIEINEKRVPNYPYNLVLYNPPTRHGLDLVKEEIKQIKELLQKNKIDYIWIEPNGDLYSEYVSQYVTHFTLPRPEFLGLMKNCEHFITNSSCQYFEGKHLLKPKQIISIGKRNIERESKYSDMDIPNASDNIIKVLEELDDKK